MKPVIRSLLTGARDRVRSIVRPRGKRYRPNLSDAHFVGSLVSALASDQLSAAQRALAGGDMASARALVVSHFRMRRAPRFFCDYEQVSSLANQVQQNRPAWVDAQVERVDKDIHQGLRILSTRGAPLMEHFDWGGIPAGPGDDDLYPAQSHRFGFMPRLALAIHYGRTSVRLVESLVDKWLVAAALGEEMTYLSPLVVLYRVLSLSWTFAFIAGLDGNSHDSTDGLLFKILKIVHADTIYLRATMGKSYPNNHLLADGFGGWYCGSMFPEFRGAEELRRAGEAIFVRELHRQIYDDGTSFEHSTHYHEVACEMAVAYLLLSRRNGIEPAAEVIERIGRMLEFQCAISGPESKPFPLGDTTEDPLFPLDSEQSWGTGAIRELYRALFDHNARLAPSDDLTVERAYWLLGGQLSCQQQTHFEDLPNAFAQGGFFVLADPIRNARLVFRSGPVENLPISAGHTHTDLLSIYLSVGGIPLVVNSGTYTYRLARADEGKPHGEWRRYFAGPESNNGLICPSDPYGVMSGDFRNRDIPCKVRQRRHAEGEGLSWLEYEVTPGNILSGYRRGIVHVHGRYWVIYDLVPDGARVLSLSTGLQFARGSIVRLNDNRTLSVRLGDAKCALGMSGNLHRSRVLQGSFNPIAGWVSPAYGEKFPAPQFRADISVDGRLSGYVLCASGDDDDVFSIVEEVVTETFVALRIANGRFLDTVLIRISETDQAMDVWGTESNDSVLWERKVGERISEHRTVPLAWA